jgi:LPS-assembly protein
MAGVSERAAAWLLGAFACLFVMAPAAMAQDVNNPILGTVHPGKQTSSFANAPKMIMPSKTIDRAQPLNLQGDQLIYDTAGNRVIARGNVEIFYNNYILTADEVIYDQSASTLSAVGNVVLKEPNGNVVRADRYTLTDDFRDGFVQSLSVVTTDNSRITADRAVRREGNVTEFENGRFTACKTEGNMPPLWCVSGARIIHDKTAQTISYQDAQFEFFGVPILYAPYFEHPDPSVKRRSGFLMPGFGMSEDKGFIAEVPYFYALAPNADFTFHPAYMSKQGVLWQGDWRHRTVNGQYSVKLAGIDQDFEDLPSRISNREKYDGWRGSIETKGQFNLGSWWKAGWDITIESDDQFRRFYGLDSILLTDRINVAYLTGQSDRNYFSAKLYQFGGLLLEDTDTSESLVHPIIDYNYVFADPVLGGELTWNSNALSFSRDDINATIRDATSITRVTSELNWRRRLTDQIGITYTPFAQLRGDLIQASNYIDPESADLVGSENFNRASVAGGATVSYPWVAHTANASHVVEPIGQIVAHEETGSQLRLPDEDARSLVFDDTNLFQISKFSGYDRIETGTRANVGLQYTFQANNGGYARFLAGQSYQLSGENLYAKPGVDADNNPIYTLHSGLEEDRSDYVLGAYLAPSDAFRVIAQSRFDEDDFSLKYQQVSARAVAGAFTGQATYAYSAYDPISDALNSQQDITASLGVRLNENWSVLGLTRYDIDSSLNLQDMIQLKYADECFVLTASYIRTNLSNLELADDSTLMLRFELKHIGEYSYKTDVLDHVFGDGSSAASGG